MSHSNQRKCNIGKETLQNQPQPLRLVEILQIHKRSEVYGTKRCIRLVSYREILQRAVVKPKHFDLQAFMTDESVTRIPVSTIEEIEKAAEAVRGLASNLKLINATLRLCARPPLHRPRFPSPPRKYSMISQLDNIS